MNFRYERPNNLMAELVKTILIIDGASTTDTNTLPAFTNGMQTLFCKTVNKNDFEEITYLTLLSTSTADIWKSIVKKILQFYALF